MWKALWDDFGSRATRLATGGGEQDLVDRTILWQLRGHPLFGGGPLGLEALHLPELSSGAPWTAEGQNGGFGPIPTELAGRWVALVLLNPCLVTGEIYPTLVQREANPVAAREFFERRFGLLDCTPKARKARNRPLYWKSTPSGISLRRSRTWTISEDILKRTAAHLGCDVPGALGRVGAVVDAIPWKFNNGSRLGDDLKTLLAAANPYLAWSLRDRFPADGPPPRAIVAMGEVARSAVGKVFGVPAGTFGVGAVLQVPGGPRLIGTYHPTARPLHNYHAERNSLAASIALAVGA